MDGQILIQKMLQSIQQNQKFSENETSWNNIIYSILVYLTTLFPLERKFYSTEWGRKINEEYVTIWNEAVMVYFKAQTSWQRFKLGTSQT
jgi:glycopeptide antibiotics resistance protein